jgi:hypothetical protein
MPLFASVKPAPRLHATNNGTVCR